MSVKFLSELKLEALTNALIDTNKFLVSDNGIVKYRTGTQLLSDLGISEGLNARNETTFIATANQTVFTVTYTVGQVDVYYNGSKLAPIEFTATNGTSITLVTPCKVNDIVDVVSYLTGLGIGGSGTTNYIPKFDDSNVLTDSLIFDNGSSVSIGTASPDSSAIYQISSTTKGFLTVRMTDVQKNAITSPATGLEVYDITKNRKSIYNGVFWDDGFRWWDYVLGKQSLTETNVSGGVVQTFSYAGTTEKRYRFISNPYDAATDIIYTTFSGGILSNPIAYRLINL
jgi:hypothetical protein